MKAKKQRGAGRERKKKKREKVDIEFKWQRLIRNEKSSAGEREVTDDGDEASFHDGTSTKQLTHQRW